MTFYLRAISKSAIKSGAAATGNPGYLHVSVLPPQPDFSGSAFKPEVLPPQPGGFIVTKDKQAYVQISSGIVHKVGSVKIEDLFKWTDISEEEKETPYYMWPTPEGDDIEKTVKAKCETLSETEAIIRTFNRVHQQSD